MTEAEIEKTIKEVLVADFDCDEASLASDTDLFKELDLDSIDAIDLVVRLQAKIGKRVNPEEFRQIRTLGDVVKAVSKILQEG